MTEAVGGGPYIELAGVTKVLGGRTVLDRLDLTVRRRETLVIMGASGSGKSVTLRHMVGLMRPDRGKVVVDGEEVHTLPESELTRIRGKVSFIFQSGALFDSMTVGENVAFGLRERGERDDQAISRRVGESLALVGLEGTEDKMPDELSGGMRKRVSIARSVVLEPECLLYDEPTAGLDPVTGFRIADLIRETAKRVKVTSVVVTHDLPAAFHVADRIAFLNQGRIAFLGPPDEAGRTRDPDLHEFLHAYEEAS